MGVTARKEGMVEKSARFARHFPPSRREVPGLHICSSYATGGSTDINTIIIAVHITNIKQLLILIIIINYFESASSDGFDTFHL